MNKKLFLYDTTLRDGAQYKGISFSLQDKLKITKLLDDFGMDYIEGGWPGSNPKDEAYFKHAQYLGLKHSKLVAFGATRKPNTATGKDPQLASLLNAQTPVVALVSKFWQYHVKTVLRTETSENLKMIYDSVDFFKSRGREVILDAEHFFDGFKDNSDYSFQCLKAAIKAGVDNVTLCDTNGGTMPDEIATIVAQVKSKYPQLSLGIHCHNDCELAVANSLASVNAGVTLLQGTVNGYGERCGNANLISLLGSLLLKPSFNQNFSLNPKIQASQLTTLSQKVANVANMPLKNDAAYVGNHAFSHKGGIHVAAIAKASQTYEHIDPALVGNQRDISISELSGKSNVLLQAEKLGLDVSQNFSQVLSSIKSLEQNGLTLENAEGSFEMLVRKHEEGFAPLFTVENIQITVTNLKRSSELDTELCTASVKLSVKNKTTHMVEEATGPVDALNRALKKALSNFFPQVEQMLLTDYKVSILDPENASAATTRVWLQSGYGDERWATIGCSDNILKASTQALIDSYQLFLIKFQNNGMTSASDTDSQHINLDTNNSHQEVQNNGNL
ncbi:citramalate synthase [Kangiella spongicola]|uniref:Citramalate synthase n=1 Tax=Kangiella spongicola TaxID=796379 RepID=A0A318D5C9_9GAMM|nr:citramalate synthase [Kangiella spongicola]PXF64063.1 citramalate synthase [Kangiella spongicola]